MFTKPHHSDYHRIGVLTKKYAETPRKVFRRKLLSMIPEPHTLLQGCVFGCFIGPKPNNFLTLNPKP